MRILRTAALFALFLFTSCDPLLGDKWPTYNNITPDGYHCHIGYPLSQDPALVMVWIDIRIADWIDARKGQYQECNLNNLAKTTTFWVIDDYHFVSGWSPTGYAAGDMQRLNHPICRCCIYTENFGQLADDGMGLPVIAFEMDHRLGLNLEF